MARVVRVAGVGRASGNPGRSRTGHRNRTWTVLAAALIGLAFAGVAHAAPGPGRVPVPEPSAQALRFHRSGLWIWVFAQAWSILVPLAVLRTGLAARVRDLAGRLGRWPAFTVAIAAALFVLVLFAVNLPLRYALGYVRLHQYGLSNQTVGRWLGQSVKGVGVSAAIAAVVAPVPYLLIRRSPGRWWLWVGLLSVPFSAFGAWVMPVVIDPLFHDFAPLADRKLEARIDALAHRAGVDGARVFQVDMSRDTQTVNAYVTGLLGSKRVVLWDTTLHKLDEGQILAIVGHELGHYVLNHVALGVGMSAFASVAGLFVIDRVARRILRRKGGRWDVDEVGDVAGLPLLYAIALALLLLTDPASMAVSRWMEHEADRFALELTRDNHAAASAFLAIQHNNLSVPYPDPFSRVWRSSHPPLGDRIEFCNDYRPWESGGPGRYGARFAPAGPGR